MIPKRSSHGDSPVFHSLNDRASDPRLQLVPDNDLCDRDVLAFLASLICEAPRAPTTTRRAKAFSNWQVNAGATAWHTCGLRNCRGWRPTCGTTSGTEGSGL